MSRQHSTAGQPSLANLNSKSKSDLKISKQATKFDILPPTIAEMGKQHEDTTNSDKSKILDKKHKPAFKKKLVKHKTEKTLPELNRRYQQPNDWNNKLLEAINKTKAFRVTFVNEER